MIKKAKIAIIYSKYTKFYLFDITSDGKCPFNNLFQAFSGEDGVILPIWIKKLKQSHCIQK